MAKFGVSIAVTEESTEQRPQYENLPNGVYALEIDSIDIKRKNENTRDASTNLNASITVVEPEELSGRKLFANYNLEHPSAQAQDIGQKQFSALRRALGLGDIDADADEEDVKDEMRLVRFIATIGMGKDSKEKNADGTAKYAARNEIKRYWYPDQNDAPPIGVAAGTSPAANDNRPAARPAAVAAKPAPAGSKPWQKKAT